MSKLTTITVFDPGNVDVIDAIVLNPKHLKKLAEYLCKWGFHDGSSTHVPADGPCDECRNKAGLLLISCPWLDMSRKPEGRR